MEMSDSNLTVNTIRAIDKTSIQKICCGQVIVDLCGAVKEVIVVISLSLLSITWQCLTLCFMLICIVIVTGELFGFWGDHR